MINIGINPINNIKIGNAQVNKVYVGTLLVWEYLQDYSTQYLTFEALQNGTFSFSKAINYSIDGGQTWTTLAANTPSPTINTGDTILWKGELVPTSSDGIGTFSSTGQFNAYGNIMSLLYGDNFIGEDEITYQYCFTYLFNGAKVVDAHNLILPATTLSYRCYYEMFAGCTSLTTAPALPATTLAEQCYVYMFSNCASLTAAPALPATTLANGCYGNMYYRCTSLTTAPELPATTLTTMCYAGMFDSCTSLTTAPELPATTLTTQCYYQLFKGCSNLNYIKMMATDISATDCLTNWVQGVSSTGTFVKNANATWTDTGDSGVPTGWTIEYDGRDYSTEYLTFEALQNGTFSFTNAIDYSIDDGQTWTTLAANTSSPTITTGNKILWKGELVSVDSGIGTFSSTGQFNAYGNTMSLIYGDNFEGEDEITMESCFYRLFYNTQVVDAHNLILPATTLYNNCYANMFESCTSLTSAPELPATTLTVGCYQSMFESCTSLTSAPELPATSLQQYCYSYMFESCYSLITAPELSATTLAGSCYSHMFESCYSLITAPELPATTLTETSYWSMFENCNNLNYIKMMATDISAYGCLLNWVYGVSSTGTFVKNANATWTDTGDSGVPTGWTVITE